MKLKLSVQMDAGRVEDVTVTSDADTPVWEVAAALLAADPAGTSRGKNERHTLRIEGPAGRQVPGDTRLDEAGIQSGQVVTITPDGQWHTPAHDQPHVAVLQVVGGPDAGSTFSLRIGSSQIGRRWDCEVMLNDPLVSKAHARLNVGEVIEIIDLGSANGVQLRGATVSRAQLGPNDVITIGDTTFRVIQQKTVSGASVLGPVVAFNRSPRLDPVFEGKEHLAPTPPAPPGRPRFPIIPLLAPVVMAMIMFAITRNAVSIVFTAMSPLMMVGTFFEGRVAGKRAFELAAQQFRESTSDLDQRMREALGDEAVARRQEHPATPEIVDAIILHRPLLWTRRPDRRGFLDIRLGLARRPSRNVIKLPSSNTTTPELWRELTDLEAKHSFVEQVPLEAALDDCGSLGIAGPFPIAGPAVRSAILQLVGMHSPAEVVLCAVISHERSQDWAWLKWLPHTSSEQSPVEGDHLAVETTTPLIDSLAGLVEVRLAASRGATGTPPLPRVVLLVDDAAQMERSEVVDLAERGPSAGVHVIWYADSVPLLPAACRQYLAVDAGNGMWVAGDVRTGVETGVSPDLAELATTEKVARSLAPVVDSGAVIDDDSALPRSVSLLDMTDKDLAIVPDAVLDQWRASHSLPSDYPKPGERRRRSKEDVGLRALVGESIGHPFTLDLRSQGPHALVGGTTGAGKSEFLQTWVLSMAASHSPDRVNFLFVDYKGGAAFGECTKLPHAVGLVTDLSPHLVRRAIVSLKAELKYREELFQDNKVTDLVAFERKDLGAAPPSLVIVVDEFAALAKEVPDFVDGVVDVAQRGRSLGLHLILATQRPSGVIKDNLRANTNLRIALRMADESDSVDVVGTKQAALFDPIPGRGLAKFGPARVSMFQTAYVGGWTSSTPPPRIVTIESLRLGRPERWEPVEDDSAAAGTADRGPNDLKRIVDNIITASTSAGIAQPRVPWQPELAEVYELARIKPSRNDRELVFGVADDPQHQRQVPVHFEPDRDGNVAVFGTGGSGKSAFLRTLAISAGLSTEGPCHVYGLDFGSRGLSMLEALPYVGSIIGADDSERIARLLRFLRTTIDERALRYSRARTASITDFREAADAPDEPRILVLLDGFGAFRTAYESGANQALYDLFLGIASDGRPVGVHVAISADRPTIVPGSLGSNIQRRLVLRLAQESDYSTFGVPADAISAASPAGRGFIDGFEVQVAVLGGQGSNARQSAAIGRLADELRSSGRRIEAPPIARLQDNVDLANLPVEVGGLPVLGVADDTLRPLGFDTSEPLLVTGPPQADRAAFVLAMIQSLERLRGSLRTVLFSARTPRLASAFAWSHVVVGADDVAELARSLTAAAEGPAIDLLVIENVTEFSDGPADKPLQDLIRVLGRAGTAVIADADSNVVAGVYGVTQLMRVPRHGIALQPDQVEGDNIFRTSFPKASRAEFPVGRGFYVRHGRATKVQCARPIAESESPS